jgi:hypothetical protein
MKRINCLVAAATLLLASCSVGGGQSIPPTLAGDKILVSNVEGLTPDAATVKILVSDNSTGEIVELSSAPIENGNATLSIPTTIEDNYLKPLSEDAPAAVELSDTDVKYTFINFMVYDSAGKLIGSLYFETSTVWTDLIYVDSPCTITGTETNRSGGETDIYDLDLAKGYNWTKYVAQSDTSESWVNGTPSGVKWVYYYIW